MKPLILASPARTEQEVEGESGYESGWSRRNARTNVHHRFIIDECWNAGPWIVLRVNFWYVDDDWYHGDHLMSDACLRILFLLTTTASLLPATTIVFSGVVLQANPNSLGITTSSTVSGSIDYSIALIGSGSESISPSGTFTTFADPTLSVDIRIESFTATTTEEVGYPDGPEIGFVDGQLDYLLFWKDAFDCSTGTGSGDCYFHAFDVINIVPPVGNFEFVFYEDSGGGPVEFARGEFSSFQVIPEPGSFALMGAGLAALVIGWRRKRAACGRRGAPS